MDLEPGLYTNSSGRLIEIVDVEDVPSTPTLRRTVTVFSYRFVDGSGSLYLRSKHQVDGWAPYKDAER